MTIPLRRDVLEAPPSRSVSAAATLPEPHAQWAGLDLVEVFAQPTLLIVIGQSNSILSPFGAQAHERIWERARRPGGTLGNTLRLVSATRAAGQRVGWTRYEIFREHYAQTLVDQAQYGHWLKGKEHWSGAEKARDGEIPDEVKAAVAPGDLDLFYATLGNVFLGTMLPQQLTALGIRTVVFAGYHLDWCIEQGARTARDIGFNPIVIGDATAAGREEDEAPTLSRIDTFFAPVIGTDRAIDLIARGAARRDARARAIADAGVA